MALAGFPNPSKFPRKSFPDRKDRLLMSRAVTTTNLFDLSSAGPMQQLRRKLSE
jgi:hypothetical protein